jgi:23S rRNA-intervening sequence protein
VANRRINPDASTSPLHAGSSSTRHLEPRDGLRRRRLRVHCEIAGAGEIQSGFTTSAFRDVCSAEYIAEGCGTASNTEFSRFLGYAYRSLKEVVTALELCQRLYPSLPTPQTESLINEGNQISKMIYGLIQKVDPGNHLR